MNPTSIEQIKITPEQIKKVVDAVFTELELLTAARPILSFAVHALHTMVDSLLVARVATKLTPPKTSGIV